METYEYKKKFSIFETIKLITREYFLGTAIYLNSLFILKINNGTTPLNAIFWMILINLIYEQFIIRDFKYESTRSRKEALIGVLLRGLFMVVNIFAFGFNIFA